MIITDESLKEEMRERGKFLDKSLVKMSIPKNILDFISDFCQRTHR